NAGTRCLRLDALRVGDEPRILHRAKHESTTRFRRIRIGDRVVSCGRLDATGKHRRLRQTQLRSGFAEKSLGSSLDPVDARSEINAVQVKREDLLFRVARLQIERERSLLQLALKRAVGVEEEILG